MKRILGRVRDWVQAQRAANAGALFGASTIFDIFGTGLEAPHGSIEETLEADWRAIGNDMRAVMHGPMAGND